MSYDQELVRFHGRCCDGCGARTNRSEDPADSVQHRMYEGKNRCDAKK
jgi:hypothetical protein